MYGTLRPDPSSLYRYTLKKLGGLSAKTNDSTMPRLHYGSILTSRI